MPSDGQSLVHLNSCGSAACMTAYCSTHRCTAACCSHAVQLHCAVGTHMLLLAADTAASTIASYCGPRSAAADQRSTSVSVTVHGSSFTSSSAKTSAKHCSSTAFTSESDTSVSLLPLLLPLLSCAILPTGLSPMPQGTMCLKWLRSGLTLSAKPCIVCQRLIYCVDVYAKQPNTGLILVS
jgi:hypothetical protein